MKLPSWMNSIRAWSVLIVLGGITAGLFLAKVTPENYMQVALIVVTAYFAKRDMSGDRPTTPTEELPTDID